MPPPQFVPLRFEPGVWKNGTLYQARGRWHDATLMRWDTGEMSPIGGWRTWGESTTAVTGVPRTAIAWKDNTFRRWLAVGSASKLMVYNQEAGLTDITPTTPIAFTAGRTDASPGQGYGNSTYGTSSYGTPRADMGDPEPATIWTFDLWGEDLVGCTPEDGNIWQWSTAAGTPTSTKAARVANSPQYAIATAVTDERIHMVFGGVPSGGAEADRDRRKIFWSDIEDNTDWTATATNHAGDHVLETAGDLLGAVKLENKLLIFTTVDAHTASYIGLPYVYSFDRVGTNCGPVSVNAVAVVGNTAYWMGRSAQGFFQYDGYVRPIPCDVQSFIVDGMTEAQSSKVVAWSNTLHNEIWWFYPSETVEINAYVSYNYLEDHWSVGTLPRTAAISRGTFERPILFDSSGNPYEHEVGGTYEDVDETVLVPYAESGPIELGDGNRVLSATSLIPDVTALADITTTFYTRMYPTDSDTTHGPYTMAAPTSVRFTGRTVRMRCTSNSSNQWDLGVPRLEVKAGGRR